MNDDKMKVPAYIVHNDYKSIEQLMYASGRINVSMVVMLSILTKHDTYYNYHSEMKYDGGVKLLLKPGTYFVKLYNPVTKISVKFDLITFRYLMIAIENAFMWMSNPKYFEEDSLGEISCKEVGECNFHSTDGTNIEFRSHVWKNTKGIIVYIGDDENNASFLTDRDILALFTLFQNFNLYHAAQALINYVGRPEPGTNIFEFN